VLHDRINTHELSRPPDASAPEEVYFPPGVVPGHTANNRRHRPAARVPGQPSDLAQHEPHTEKLPQGVERCVGSDRLRAGPPDGRRQWRHEDVRFLRTAVRGPGTASGVLSRRRQRTSAGNFDWK